RGEFRRASKQFGQRAHKILRMLEMDDAWIAYHRSVRRHARAAKGRAIDLNSRRGRRGLTIAQILNEVLSHRAAEAMAGNPHLLNATLTDVIVQRPGQWREGLVIGRHCRPVGGILRAIRAPESNNERVHAVYDAHVN